MRARHSTACLRVSQSTPLARGRRARIIFGVRVFGVRVCVLRQNICSRHYRAWKYALLVFCSDGTLKEPSIMYSFERL